MKRTKPLVLISSCILGNKVRFNGGHTKFDWITDYLAKYVDFVPICPEMAMGMGAPREQIHIEYKRGEESRLIGRSGTDYTLQMNAAKEEYSSSLLKKDFDGIIMQAKSPSCALERVKYRNSETGIPDKVEAGIFGKFFIENFPNTPMMDSGRLINLEQRHIFLSKLFANFDFKQNVNSISTFQEFHQSYKYLLMGHDQNKLREMGRLAAKGESLESYRSLLLSVLSSRVSKKNIVNSIFHMLGYLKNDLELNEKKFIHDLLEEYSTQSSLDNKVEPILSFLVEKYNVSYLKSQKFFNPYPRELRLEA